MTNKAEGRMKYINEVYRERNTLTKELNEIKERLTEIDTFLYWFADEKDISKIELKLNLTNKNY